MDKKLLFRLDDIAPGLVSDNLRRLEEIFDRYDVKPLLGVVPNNKDPRLVKEEADEDEFWTNVTRLHDKGWPVAMHGYEHVYCTKDSGLLQTNPFSEFAGLPYEEQYKKLDFGRTIMELHGIKPTCFMAPGHTFDDNTLKALHDTHFWYVTDGCSSIPYTREALLMIPCTLGEAKIPKGVDTVCIHLNNWIDDDFEELDSFLKDNVKVCATWTEVIDSQGIPEYGKKIAREERRYRKIREAKRRAAASETMQRYLRKSNSSNKVIKLIKRITFLPMLLKKD